MMSCRCQSRLQMLSNRLAMGCKAIKQNCSINSPTCFILIQEEISQQKKQPFGDLRESFHFSAGVSTKIFLINLGAFLFRNTSKWLFLKQCLTRHSIIKFFLLTKRDSYGFFSHLNRFKMMSFSSFSFISDFCHLLQAIREYVYVSHLCRFSYSSLLLNGGFNYR